MGKTESLLLAPMSFRSVMVPRETAIDRIYLELRNLLKGHTKQADKANQQALSIILSNLVISALTDKWLSIPDSQKSYQPSQYLNAKLFLTQKSVRRVLSAIQAHPQLSLEKKTGNSYEKRVNLYKPKGYMRQILRDWIYEIEEPYSGNPRDYIIFKEPELKIDRRWNQRTIELERIKHEKKQQQWDSYIKLTTSLADDHPDVSRLHKINSYLAQQTYALKQPISLIYGVDIATGGRLYCATQRLPDKRARIRINTFINNVPVCEVDFKANHLRILAAYDGIELPEDPYLEISKSTRLERNKVKTIITRMIGASGKAFDTKDKNNKVLFSHQDKKPVEDFLHKKYPTIWERMHKGYGKNLQSHEGQILLNAMCSLVDLNVPSLPVHDSLMVPQAFAKVASEILKEQWRQEFRLSSNFAVFLSIDYP